MAQVAYPTYPKYDTYPLYSPRVCIQRGLDLRDYLHPTYSQKLREWTMWQHHYDCSSFIAAITGYGEIFGSGPATPEMDTAYQNYGYKYMKFSPGMKLQSGDILVWNWSGSSSGGAGNDGHTVMYMGDKYGDKVIEMTGTPYNINIKQYNDIASSKNEYYTFVLRNPHGGLFIQHWTPTDGIPDGF